MRLGQRLAGVALRAPEEATGERQLLLDQMRLVLPLEQEAHDGVDEELVIERLQDRAYRRFAADDVVGRHPKRTSAPVDSFTTRAIVAKSSSPWPLSSIQRAPAWS